MKISLTLSCIAALLTASVGCSSFKAGVNGWNPLASVSGQQDVQTHAEPATMAVVWKDSVYEQPGKPSIKGFGGRFFVYDARNNPIKAEGELIVYGYDESNPIHADGSHTGADKKFVFPSDKFQQHFSDSDLGASYSVWIPWEKVGGPRKSITLIPVLKTTGGNVLRCGQSLIVLPGRKPIMDNANATVNVTGAPITNSQNLVAQASFEKPASSSQDMQVSHASEPNSTTKQRVRTTTLNVPASLAKRLATSSQPNQQNRNALLAQLKEANGNSQAANKPELTAPSSTTKAPSTPTEQLKARVFGAPGSF